MARAVGLIGNGVAGSRGNSINHKVTAIPYSNVIEVSISAGAVTINGGTQQELTGIAPGVTVTVEAAIPESSTNSSTVYYHNGSTPSNGNYYYNLSNVYEFEKWLDAVNNVVMSTNQQYSFSMPVNDITLTAYATHSTVETNKTYVCEIQVVNNDTTNVDKITIDGTDYTSSGTIYRWPNQGSITISGTPKTGETITNNGVITSRSYSVTTIRDSKGNTTSASSLSINPSESMIYYISGTHTDSTIDLNTPLTWAQFSALLDSNTYNASLLGGQVKDSNGHNWRIIKVGSNYYDLWYQETIGNNVFNSSYQSQSNCYWVNSQLRSNLNGSLFYNDTSKLPADMKSRVINKTVNAGWSKYSGSWSHGGTNQSTDKVWLLTATEIGFTSSNHYITSGDGELYSYFDSASKRNNSAVAGSWSYFWTASGILVADGSGACAWRVGTNGNCGNGYVGNSYGVVPAVRIA